MNIHIVETILGVIFGAFLSVLAIVGAIQFLIKLRKSKKDDFVGGVENSNEQGRKPVFSVGLTIIMWGLFIYGIYIIAGNINYNLNPENYSGRLATINDSIMYYTHFIFFSVSAIIMIITGIYRYSKMAKQQALIPEAQLQTYLDRKKETKSMIAFGAVILCVTTVILIYNS